LEKEDATAYVRDARTYDVNGETMTVAEIANRRGITTAAVYNALASGKTPEEIVASTTTRGQIFRRESDGLEQTLREWAETLEIKYDTIRSMIRRGLDMDAVTDRAAMINAKKEARKLSA
jgi:AcrR family transcriptional regulator